MKHSSKPATGPGVPEGLPTTLALVRERLGDESLDRLWIFPPLTHGRHESGLVAVSCFATGDRRRLFTAAYTAERTGRGLEVEPALTEQGLAPSDRFPRMMAGVVRRSTVQLGDPQELVIDGDPSVLEGLMSTLEARVAREEP